MVDCKNIFGVLLLFISITSCSGQKTNSHLQNENSKEVNNVSGNAKKVSSVTPGAERLDEYLPLLQNKTVAVFANQTSVVKHTHLVDVLQKSGVKIKVIFGPEHGFRGKADAGEHIESGIDKATGIPVVSLYGSKRKPSKEDLKDVDVMLFDIQDVGVRFYTYISSLQDYMEAALEYNIPLIVLDRPNPNGFYIDGPVLEEKFKSFVGMQPVPIVYGMTIGEYAGMILQEQWLSREANNRYRTIMASRYKEGAKYFKLIVIPCAGYTHKSKYILPVKPSPNLPEIQSIYLYPFTCFFEGTVLSEGRGTDKPFQIFGHPSLPQTLYSFTPTSRDGAKEPKLKNQLSYGWNLSGSVEDVLKKVEGKIRLKWLLQAYQLFPDKKNFFLVAKKDIPVETDYFFNKLAGNASLMKQIKMGMTEKEIRENWQPLLNNFKNIRKKYLLYPDFE